MEREQGAIPTAAGEGVVGVGTYEAACLSAVLVIPMIIFIITHHVRIASRIF